MPHRSHGDTSSGIACMLAGALCLALSDSMAKWLGAFYAPLQLVLARTLIAVPALVVLVVLVLGPRGLRTRNLRVHLLRGLINVLAALCFFTGITRMPLAHATAIAFCAPLFITALSVLVLRETVSIGGWLAVLVGFLGVLLVVQPGSGQWNAAVLFPIATALFYALMMVSARWIRPGEHMLTTMTYIVLCQLVFTAPVAAWFWAPIAPEHWLQVVGMALFGSLGLGLITQAFRLAPASVVAPFDYSALIWATLLGWVVWQDAPDLWFYLGSLLIVAAGLYTALGPRVRRTGGK